MDTLRTYWNNTKEMPFLLRVLCQGGMFAGPILLVFLALPIADWTFNGKRMSYSELRSSGVGLVMLVFIGLVIVGTWGMAARQPTSRWALVLAPLVPIILALAFPQLRSTVPLDPVFFLQVLVTPAIIYGCLFHLASIRKYFGNERTSA